MSFGASAIRTCLALAVLVSAGCSNQTYISESSTEVAVKVHVEQVFDVELDQVKCPQKVKSETGTQFECRIPVLDDELIVKVTQLDETGRVEVEPLAAVLIGDRVQAQVKAELAKRFGREKAEVNCEMGTMAVIKAGTSIPCGATDGDEGREIEVRVLNVDGALAVNLR